MKRFDSLIKTNLAESVITISKNDVDPAIFLYNDASTPTLRENIRVQILRDIDEIRNVAPVVNFWLVGDILTKNYEPSTEIEVMVQVDPGTVDAISTADMMHLLKNINNRLAGDTRHPISYYPITYELDISKLAAVYDIVNDRWLKAPRRYDPDVELWVSKFQDTIKSIDLTTGALRRDLIDLDAIRSLSPDNTKRLKLALKQKLVQIEEMLKQLISTYDHVKYMKDVAMNRYMTPREIQEFGSKNRIPENVLYKMLEKYYYTSFIRKIESILDETGNLELTDIPQLRKAMGAVWKS